jgi:hypothetical protein
VVIVLSVLVLAVAVSGAFYKGPALRQKAAQHRLAQHWAPPYRVLPLLGLAHAASLADAGRLPRADLDRLWREMKSYKGTYPVLLWLELAWLEVRAGHQQMARQALVRARQADAKLYNFWLRHKRWDPWRTQLGLPEP